MSHCNICGLPIFYGSVGYAGPVCQCQWRSVAPIHMKQSEQEKLHGAAMDKLNEMISIAQLNYRIAELEAAHAAAVLNNQQLREALEKTRGALAYVKGNGRDNPNLMESTAWHGLGAADKALAKPTSTETLDAYVAEKVKELNDEHRRATLIRYEQTAEIIRQRDLAVEALEKVGELMVCGKNDELPGRCSTASKLVIKALSTIKGSEK